MMPKVMTALPLTVLKAASAQAGIGLRCSWRFDTQQRARGVVRRQGDVANQN